MIKEDAAKVLNELIETSEDGKKGFEAAAERAEDTKLKLLFSERARECATAATELQQSVRELGFTAKEGGSISGAAHRGWVAVKAAVSHSDLSVLEEVERGEDYAKAVYGKALKDDLPPQVKTLVERQYQGVIRNHDRVRDLRNQYRNAA